MENRQTKVTNNLFWRFMERIGAQGVSFIVSIILARLLAPEVYGTIALVTVFTTILNVFVDSGLGTALIQKKDSDDVDFSTVFYFNIIFCMVLYGLMFLFAPFIAGFYDDISLIPVIRVLSLTIIISGVRNVQQAYVSKNLIFRKFFFSTLGGVICSAFIGIYLAYQGYGVWALVSQQLINSFIGTIILWLIVRWRPKLCFSFKRLKVLYTYGWKLLVSSLINTLSSNIRQLVIGKKYSEEDLAFYNKGNEFPKLLILSVNSSIDSVLLPTMSSQQDKKDVVKNMTRRVIKISIYVMAPLMMGLAFTANNAISVLLTEKWLPCTIYMSIFCTAYMFYPLHTANLNAIKAMGRSDYFLKLEIIKVCISFATLFATMLISVEAMAYSMLFTTFTSQIINSWPNKKLLNYGYLDQIKDIMPSILLAVFMGICILPLNLLPISKLFVMSLQIVCGGIIYILGSIIFKFESFTYVVNIVNIYINKLKKYKNT